MKQNNADNLHKELEELRKENMALKKELKHLKRSEALYKAIFEFSPSGILIVDRNGNILEANPAFCKNHGYNKSELVNNSVTMLADSDNSEKVKGHVKRLLNGEQLQHRVTNKKKDGSIVFVELNERRIELPDGQMGIISISQDKTKQILTEQALKSSEKEFSNLIKLLPYGVLIYNLDGQVIYANREVMRILKYDKNKHDDILGKSVLDYIHEDDVEKVKRRFEGLLKGQKQTSIIEKIFDFEGNEIEVEVTSRRTIFKGKPALLVIIIDISERQKAERELKQAERFYRRLFEFAPHPEIIQCEGKIVAINREAVQFFKISTASELIGKSVAKLAAKDTPLSGIDLNNGRTTRSYRNIKFKIDKNEERFADITAARTFYAGQSAVQLVFHDVTELYHAMEKLRESEETYRELFDKSSEAIYVQDKDGFFIDVNRGVLNMYGYSKSFFIGKTPDFLSAPGMNDLNIIKKHIERAFQGEPQQFEFWGIRKNGEVFPKIVRLNKGKYFGKDIILAFAVDISEQKKTEQSLKKSNETLELMNAVSQIGISSRSPEDMAERLAHVLKRRFPLDAFILDGFYPGTDKYYGFGNFDTIDGEFKKVTQFDTNFNWKKSRKRRVLFNERRSLCILRSRAQVEQIELRRRKNNNFVKASASLIYVPLVLGSTVMGVLSIQSYQYKAYTPEHLQLANRIGMQIAPAIERLMLNMELIEQAEKLRENEMRYRLLFDLAMDYILIIDPYHKQGPTIVDANESAFKMHGYTREEFIGLPLTKLETPKNKKRMKQRLQEILSKENVIFETVHICKNGSQFPVEVNAQLIELQGRSYIYAMERDISERKKAEEALKQSETKYRQLVNNALTGIYITQGSVIQFCNQQFAEMFGYQTADALVGKHIKELLAPQSWEKEYKKFRQLENSNGQTSRFEFQGKKKDGSLLVAEALCASISFEGKHAIQGTIIDITERRRAEESVTRLATVVEQSVEAIEITDLDGTIQYVNKAMENLSGYKRTEIIGQNTRIHKSGRHDQKIYSDLWETILSGKKWQGIFINKRKDGSIYYEKAVIFPIKDTSKNIINFAAIHRDITLERKLEQQIQQMQKMEAIGTLTGGIAHDFNNLLTVINGHAEIGLMRVNEKDRVHSDLLSILNAGKRAERLTSQLLAFSRKQIHELKIVQINDVISELEKILLRLIPENISVSTNLSDGLPYIKADPAQIEQILINLIVNARDALLDPKNMSTKKQICIKTESVDIDDYMVKEQVGIPTGVYIVLSVSDTGIGIAKEIKDRIFEPFFTTKEVNKGTGLGLATVYGIVKQNKGYIFVDSEKGEGSTFSIYWPVTHEQPEQDFSVKMPNENLVGNESILFIEDDESVRSFTCQALRNFGYTIYEAVNGINAVKLIDKEKIVVDFIITDLIMPEMDGRELGEEIKRKLPFVKILYVSGYVHDHMIEDGVLQPGVNFLQKPYSIKELLKMIRRMLDGKSD